MLQLTEILVYICRMILFVHITRICNIWISLAIRAPAGGGGELGGGLPD